jgi:hypothetical protein
MGEQFVCRSCRGSAVYLAVQSAAPDQGEVRAIADFLIDQQDEPWPSGSDADRLHYWRDKAIEASNRLRQALARGL